MSVTELAYIADSARLFGLVADQPWAAYLDSGGGRFEDGRYDVLAVRPYITITTFGQRTMVARPGRAYTSGADPFSIVADLLDIGEQQAAELPFTGGAIGYFGYDLAWRLESLPRIARRDARLPDMAIGVYDVAVVIDHVERTTWVACGGRDENSERLVERWRGWVKQAESGESSAGAPLRAVRPLASNLNRDQYRRRFERVMGYIRDGDCYQANLAQRFTAPVEGEPWECYELLRTQGPAPFGAYLNTPYGQILSNSPERFLRCRNGGVWTSPVKGTRPRMPDDPKADLTMQQELRDSEKDRAENLMIVDLLRNDLGKTCRPGSIEVEALFQVHSFANVHHLVSTIRGRLAEGNHALDLLRGCFPGGSITGAPKVRAMEIIEELEPHGRGVYCGAIGYVGYDGNMDTNIAIRTMIHSGGQVEFSAGGGLVADSTLDAEYQESLDKAAVLMRCVAAPGAQG